MFKTIIQPTGIYNVSQIKSQAQSNSSKSPAENIPNTVQDNNKQEKKSEKKIVTTIYPPFTSFCYSKNNFPS